MSPIEQAASAATITKPVSTHVVSISIIIPALNEEKMIGRCLESLSQLAFPQDRFEVLVVDNGSRDNTLAIVESFKDRLNLKVLQQAGVRISALRNLGARTASGDILGVSGCRLPGARRLARSHLCISACGWCRRAGRALFASGRFVVGRKNVASLSGSAQVG